MRHRRLAAAALATAILLVLLGTWGHLNPGGFVVVERLDHVFALGVSAALLAGVGVALLVPRTEARVVALAPAVAVALLWAQVGLVLSGFGGEELVARSVAPGAPYVAVVHLTYENIPDPTWHVTIRSGDGLLARDIEVGCIDGDDPTFTFEKVRWADATHLVVRVASESSTVVVDPESGDPRSVEGQAFNC